MGVPCSGCASLVSPRTARPFTPECLELLPAQKFRLELQNIIREKNSSHPAVWNFSYKAFQQRILLFFEDYLDNAEPFLLQVSLGLVRFGGCPKL